MYNIHFQYVHKSTCCIGKKERRSATGDFRALDSGDRDETMTTSVRKVDLRETLLMVWCHGRRR